MINHQNKHLLLITFHHFGILEPQLQLKFLPLSLCLAAIILQQYETVLVSKYPLRIYHSFFPLQVQVTKRELLTVLP